MGHVGRGSGRNVPLHEYSNNVAFVLSLRMPFTHTVPILIKFAHIIGPLITYNLGSLSKFDVLLKIISKKFYNPGISVIHLAINVLQIVELL